MPEQFRTRDCVILKKGDTFPVTVTDSMALNGWKGGQGVQYAPSTQDELLVDYSTGFYAGFILFGSDEISDQFTGMTKNQPTYRYTIIGAGGWVIMTTSYEQYTWESRQGGGPLVPIIYKANDRLVFSLRGYWTNEDEWTLSSDPRGANNYFIGFLVQVPTGTAPIYNYMTIQVSI